MLVRFARDSFSFVKLIESGSFYYIQNGRLVDRFGWFTECQMKFRKSGSVWAVWIQKTVN